MQTIKKIDIANFAIFAMSFFYHPSFRTAVGMVITNELLTFLQLISNA